MSVGGLLGGVVNSVLTVQDLCRGMTYLSTTPIKSHGRLKASNCVVDNRWTLKITGHTNIYTADTLSSP